MRSSAKLLHARLLKDFDFILMNRALPKSQFDTTRAVIFFYKP